MSMFNLKEVQEETRGNGGSQTYIYPGIRHNVIIAKWAQGKSSLGTPFIAVHLVTKEGKEANVEPKAFEFYVSPAAMEMSLQKIKHIVTKVTTVKAWESKEPANLEEMIEHLNDISKGESLRMKFTGEEYKNSAGDIKEAARIGLPDFAEAIQEGAEHPPVADEDTKLTFDKNNKYDFKKLETEAPTPEDDVEESSSDSLPF